MKGDGLRWLDPAEQVRVLHESITDPRPAHPTGFNSLDMLLRRGGMLPGNLVVLAGRTGTRKTTTALNMAVNMVDAGTPVGFVGLDEAPWLYAVKAMSVVTGRSMEAIEGAWESDSGRDTRAQYKSWAHGKFHVFTGRRPTPEHLDSALALAELQGEEARPQVVFIDFLGRLSRQGDYGYSETSRIPRLVEDLQVWSTDREVTVILLHQLSRNDEHGGTNSRNAGHIPVSKTQLKYAGEDDPDIILGTYRPSLNPIANMAMNIAKEVLGDRFDEDEYWELKALAKKYERSTFLQLLKNRPGTQTEERGIELWSPDDSLRLVEREAEDGHDVRATEAASLRRGTD